MALPDNPITREEMYLSNIAGEGTRLPDQPLTRVEQYLSNIAGEETTLPEYPITRVEQYLDYIANNGGGDVVVESLTVTENGTYSEEGKAYSPVVVNVTLPENTYFLKSATAGDIVTFNDGADAPLNDLECELTPVQDLHGYDRPWAGGAGKNLFGDTIVLTGMAENNGVYTNTLVDGRTEFNMQVLAMNGSTVITGQSMIISTEGKYNVTLNITSEPTTIRVKHNGSTQDFIVRANFTQTGTFTLSLQVTKCNPSIIGGLEFKDVMLESGSTATSYVPYSNICPISGWDEVEVVNMSDVTNRVYFDGLLNGTYGVVDLGSLGWQRQQSTVSGNYYFVSDVISDMKIQAGNYNIWTNLIISYPYTKVAAAYIALGNAANKTYAAFDGRGIRVKDDSYSDATTFKTAMSGVHLIYELARPTTPTITPTEFNALLEKFEIGGYVVTVTLPDTIYGGTLDVTTGLLTVDRASVDLGTLTWGKRSGGVDFDVFEAALTYITQKTYTFGICSKYPLSQVPGGYSEMPNNTIVGRSSGTMIYIHDDSYTDATTFKTAMDGVQLVYELATPQTYQLTPTAVKSLLGYNNIFTNSGDITSLQYFSKTRE